MKSISEDECVYLMGNILLECANDVLSIEDKDNLEDYAGKLFSVDFDDFNREFNKEHIKDMLRGLVGRVYDYKLKLKPLYLLNIARCTYPDKYKNDQMKKPQALQDAITKVIDLMGGDLLSTSTGAELKKMLKNARDNPTVYIPTKPKIAHNKKPIKEYLSSLQLGKPQTIKKYLSIL